MEATTTDPRRWFALVLLCASFFMVVLDTAIVVVAMPSIELDLGFTRQNLQWILSAYALTYGGLLLLGGRSADLLGRRRVFMTGLGLFTLASLVSGLSWSPETLIAARAVAPPVRIAVAPPQVRSTVDRRSCSVAAGVTARRARRPRSARRLGKGRQSAAERCVPTGVGRGGQLPRRPYSGAD